MIAQLEIENVDETIDTVMRYSAEHKQETRKRIVWAAARQFCRPGGKGLAIADLMRELGLTHGGFYEHFDSKQQLLTEAISGFDEMDAGIVDVARVPQQ